MKNSLKIVVFGATGRIGSLMVNQALAQGHMVTAFMRTPAKLAKAGVQSEHGRLRLIRGDAHDPEQVAAAVYGQDAVLSAIGINRDSGPEVLTDLAKNLIAAMQEHQVRRLISLSAAGVNDAQDSLSIGRSLMRVMRQLLANEAFRDVQGHAALLRASGLSWTLVRPERLTNGKKRGIYRTGSLRFGLRQEIARADVADFMLKLATEGGYEQQAPMVCY